MALTTDTSETGLANFALSAAEVPSTVSDLNMPNNKAARVCRFHLPRARDAVLRSYGFAFSRFLEEVPEVPVAHLPASFSAAFETPADCLRVLKVEGLRKRDWRTDGSTRILAACAAGNIKVHFVKRIADFTLWDPLAFELVGLKLAIAIAPELTHVQGITGRLREQFKELAMDAPKIDAFEQDSIEDDYDDDHYVPSFIAVRA